MPSRDEPPQWLKEVVREHSPAVAGDIVCMGCTIWLNGGVLQGVTWTPDHLSRKIHDRMGELIAEKLYAAI